MDDNNLNANNIVELLGGQTITLYSLVKLLIDKKLLSEKEILDALQTNINEQQLYGKSVSFSSSLLHLKHLIINSKILN